MEISLQHSLTYSTEGDIPVSVVAKNLLANERLIQESIRILGDCFTGVQIQKISVKVAHLSNNSPLKEVFAIALFLTYQEDLEKEIPLLIYKAFEYEIPIHMETIVTVLALMTAIYIVDKTIERLLPGKETKRLKETYEEKLLELSKMTNLNKEDLERSLQQRVNEGRLKSLAKKALDFFAPAKGEARAEILVQDEVAVPRDVIDEIPSEIDLAAQDSRNAFPVDDVEIEIHRSDIDYKKSGWVAVIDEVSDKRKKLVLPPDIAPETLFGRKTIRGNILVIEELTQDGEYVIKEFQLIEIIE